MDVSRLERGNDSDHADFPPMRLGTTDVCFDEIYREYFAYVWTNLRRLGVSELDLDDAVQDVFLVMHRRANEFEGRSTVKTWLYGIARRIAFRYRRAVERSQRRSQALADLDREAGDLDRDFATRQAWSLLYAFLDTLDDDKREAFVIGEFEGLNREQLGVALGVNPNTAYSRLRAARERFEHVFANEARRRVLIHGELQRRPSAMDRRRVWALLVPQIGGPLGAVPQSDAGPQLGWSEPTATTSVTTSGGGASMAVYLKAAVLGLAVAGGTTLALVSTDPAPRVVVQHEHADERVADDSVASAGVLALPEPSEEPSTPRVAVSAPTEIADPPDATKPEFVDDERSSRPLRSDHRRPKQPRLAASASVSPSRLAVEVDLITRARNALADHRADTALTLLHQHANDHRNGELAVVRRTLRIDALCQQGRVVQARREARVFLAEHGASSEAAHVRRSCGGSGELE